MPCFKLSNSKIASTIILAWKKKSVLLDVAAVFTKTEGSKCFEFRRGDNQYTAILEEMERFFFFLNEIKKIWRELPLGRDKTQKINSTTQSPTVSQGALNPLRNYSLLASVQDRGRGDHSQSAFEIVLLCPVDEVWMMDITVTLHYSLNTAVINTMIETQCIGKKKIN